MSVDQEFWRLAARFVEFVHGETKLPLIVCDDQGIIREAVVRSRIGTAHAGAQRLVRGEVDEAFVTAEEAAANPTVKEGYTSNNIQGTLRDVTASVHRLDEAGRASSAEAAQAVETLREVEGLLGSLRSALEGQGTGRDLRTGGAGQRRVGSSSR